MGFREVGEPSRLAREARITGEIWKMNIKGSVAWDFVRWGSPPGWFVEPESQARSGKWILKAQYNGIFCGGGDLRITGEISKMYIKCSEVQDFFYGKAFQTGAWSPVQVYERVVP